MILVLAAAMTYTGVRRTFMGDLDVRRLAPSARRAIAAVCALGHIARAAALAVIGLSVGSAAVFADPRRAGGLDAALHALGETSLGDTLLVVIALGFAAFGLYCLVDAATRKGLTRAPPRQPEPGSRFHTFRRALRRAFARHVRSTACLGGARLCVVHTSLGSRRKWRT